MKGPGELRGMTKRFCITICLVLGAIVGVFVWSGARPSEPVYQGKTLSRWLENHVPTSSAYNSPGWMIADNALRHIGTNAIPTLLQMIRAKELPPAMPKLLDMARIPYRYAFARNEEAAYAFETLGTNAASAVPALIRIYEKDVSASSQRCAALALGHIGPAAKAAIPVLLRNFTHTNADVRIYAVSAVSQIGGEPSVVVLALKSALKDSKLEVRWGAVVALGNFEARARSAVPELLEALEDPAKLGNATIREQVEVALWRIAPEKIAKPLVVEDSTPMVAKGVTTEALDLLFNGERNTLIQPGTPVPCVAACWSSEPRGLLRLYRGTHQSTAKNYLLGQFEVMGLPSPPTSVNAQVLCVIANQQIFLCARDYNRKMFLEIHRVENEITK